MKREEILSVFQAEGISPIKKLGQNFLLDENLLDFIVRTADPEEGQYVIEIGPGLGALTKFLLEKKVNLTAIEYDAKIVSYLRKKYGSALTLIHEDACKVDFDKLTRDIHDFTIISNLPYAISTPLLAKISEMKKPPLEMTLLLQKETAMRFISLPKTKAYGAISVKIQNIFHFKYIRNVSPEVFYPKPDVVSGIVKFFRKDIIPDPELRKKMDKLLRIAFSKRRKKLINTIAALFDSNLSDIFNELKINENVRPEELIPEQYLALSSLMVNC